MSTPAAPAPSSATFTPHQVQVALNMARTQILAGASAPDARVYEALNQLVSTTLSCLPRESGPVQARPGVSSSGSAAAAPLRTLLDWVGAR